MQKKILRAYLLAAMVIVICAIALWFVIARLEILKELISESSIPIPDPDAEQVELLLASEPPEPAEIPEPAIRYSLSAAERDLIERVVMAEAGNQPLEGQMAVAQCILNTAEAESMRPDEVVLKPKQYAAPVSAERVTDSVRQSVSAVFDHGETVTDEPIRYFYAPARSSSAWHETALAYVMTIEDHKFFKEL